jgi:rare lipoprotein A
MLDYLIKQIKEDCFPFVLGMILLLCILLPMLARAEILTASWYSVQSLKDEGTYKYSKGVMANGKLFADSKMVAATRIYPLGAILLVSNPSNGTSVTVRVTDRIGKRFATKRIDLSKGAFAQIANLQQGITKVSVERIK